MSLVSKKAVGASTQTRIARRTFLTGAIGAAAAAAPGAAGVAEASVSTWAQFASQGGDGTTLVYPANWTLEPCLTLATSINPNYLYPHQAFGLHSVSQRPAVDLGRNGGAGLDFSRYPRSAVVLWLRYYDTVVEAAPFQGLSLSALDFYVEEYGFRSYLLRFSNSQRTYLMRAWLGRKASASTISALDTTLQSIRIPS